jgi:Icc-related predicted phosphoesterase
MKQSALTLIILCIGLTAGYLVYPVVNPQPLVGDSSGRIMSTQHSSVALSENQIKELAAKIAPVVAEHLVISGALNSNPQLAIKQQEAEKIRIEKETAFSQAQQSVDEMILSKSITETGLNHAVQLLTETGQEDKIYLLRARIAVAVNKGELTPKQAGFDWADAL